MDDAIERDGPEQVSRRTIIKRAGVVGAAAWSAPILSTIKTPAFAQFNEGTPAVCPDCGICVDQVPCGAGCTCITDEDGSCFCHQGSACGDLVSCTTTADCPPGWSCAMSCCFELLGLLCHPPCGTPAGQGAGPRSTPA